MYFGEGATAVVGGQEGQLGDRWGHCASPPRAIFIPKRGPQGLPEAIAPSPEPDSGRLLPASCCTLEKDVGRAIWIPPGGPPSAPVSWLPTPVLLSRAPNIRLVFQHQWVPYRRNSRGHPSAWSLDSPAPTESPPSQGKGSWLGAIVDDLLWLTGPPRGTCSECKDVDYECGVRDSLRGWEDETLQDRQK